VLVESGFTRAAASDGSEWSFTPSLRNIAELDTPAGIVELFAALHGPHAEREARYVLAVLCDQEDPAPLIGWRDEDGDHGGMMPAAEQVIIARHLMTHGIIGTAKPGKAGDGKYSATFDAAEYIAAACVHLGLSRQDAEALSMTEFQTMFRMKFPEAAGEKERDVPTREEYAAAIEAINKARGKRDV